MAQTFRRSDSAFEDKRAAYAARKSGRAARVAELESMGFDDAEGLADMPLFSDRKRENARRAFR